MARKAKIKTTTAPTIPPIVVPFPSEYLPCPKPGDQVALYSTGHEGWQKTIGAGWRFCTVIRRGRRWVTLFLPSQLATIKLSHKDWAHVRPRTYGGGPRIAIAVIKRNMEVADRLKTQYSAACAQQAIKVLTAKIKESSHGTANRRAA